MGRTVFDDIAKPFRRFNFELNIWMISICFKISKGKMTSGSPCKGVGALYSQLAALYTDVLMGSDKITLEKGLHPRYQT